MTYYEWWTCPVIGTGDEYDPKRPEVSSIAGLKSWTAEAGTNPLQNEMLILAEVEND